MLRGRWCRYGGSIRDRNLGEPVRSHALYLARRLRGGFGLDYQTDDPAAWAAGIECLATRIIDPTAQVRDVAERWHVPPWRLSRALTALRAGSDYRAYVGEWVREGCPTFEDEAGAEADSPEEELKPLAPEWVEDLGEERSAADEEADSCCG